MTTRTDDPTRWFRRGALGFAIVAGWLFIAGSNHFHISAPVVFVCLGYLAIIAVIMNFWKIGAMVAARANVGEEAWLRPMGPRDALEKEKKTLLKAIKEAEFDHEMGKLSKHDADEMIATYRVRAIAVIKELDRDESTAGARDKREKIEREVKARLEVEIEAKKRPKAKKAKAKEAST